MDREKLIIGSERTLKLAKEGKISKIYLASNIPEDLKIEAELIGKANDIEIILLKENSKQFGVKIGKPFTVLMAGELK